MRKIRVLIQPDENGEPVFTVIDAETREQIEGVEVVLISPIVADGVDISKYQATVIIPDVEW